MPATSPKYHERCSVLVSIQNTQFSCRCSNILVLLVNFTFTRFSDHYQTGSISCIEQTMGYSQSWKRWFILLIVSACNFSTSPGFQYLFLKISSYISSNNNMQVEERLVAVDELLDADEVFCTGTAVVVSPVGSITYLGKR